MPDSNGLPNCLMVGTGEYTTGFVRGGNATKSDKKCGVVALVMFDLRMRGKIGNRIGIVGTSGNRMPDIRRHLKKAIGDVYVGMNVECETYPKDDIPHDSKAYLSAMNQFERGDIVTIFTPDDTHFEIAMAAIERGLHVMITKPPVKTLEEHKKLIEASRKHNVLVLVEVHKRYDPIYSDARNRIVNLGDFSYLTSYMSQPKLQLETFRSWAGKSSDISYYLNSHHVDFHCWATQGFARPIRVIGSASSGVVKECLGVDAEDTICLTVEWLNYKSKNKGIANYTASWIAPPADVHSQQRFFYLGHRGEVTVDQAHRGYYVSTDVDGFKSVNPLYMRYTPDESGKFVGQAGYGYVSFEVFVDAVTEILRNASTIESFDFTLPTIIATQTATAVLEAGRRSLDQQGKPFLIIYNEDREPIELKPEY